MIVNILSVLVLILLVLFFAWLTRRAGGSRRAWLKWPGLVLAGLLTLLVGLLTVVVLIGFYKLYVPQGNPVSNLKAATAPDQIAMAEKYAHFCSCHSPGARGETTLPLSGASEEFLPPSLPLGTLQPPNLTPGGPLQDWSDGEIIRAIREGVHKSGRPLIVMPSDVFHNLSDADVQALVGYLRSQPAVQHDTPDTDLNALAALFVGAGLFSTSVQSPISSPVLAPPRAVTAEYGRYVVSISGCTLCHGKDFAGGQGGLGPPPGPNLTVLVPNWSEAGFVNTIRTGVDPTGKKLDSTMMPYKEFSAMYDDDQLQAIYAYLHGLTPITKPAQ